MIIWAVVDDAPEDWGGKEIFNLYLSKKKAQIEVNKHKASNPERNQYVKLEKYQVRGID